MNRSTVTTVINYSALCKIKISIFAGLSAATGFILAGTAISNGIILPVAGVFLLACGAASLNQYQDRKEDALMERTRHRPVPSGQIKPGRAVSLSFILIVSGSTLLAFTGSPAIFCGGLLAVLWYNGVYTYLKRLTPFAAVPGAMVGTVPPAIGWIAGGGNFPGDQFYALCFFFFMWQVPHFWLQLLSNDSDYARTGMPVLTRVFSKVQISRVTFSWVIALSATSLLMPMFFHYVGRYVSWILLTGALWLSLSSLQMISGDNNKSVYHQSFKRINIYALFVMVLLSAGSIT